MSDGLWEICIMFLSGSSDEFLYITVKSIPADMSVWVCIGPFNDDEMYHAEDHPNAVAICRSEPQERAGAISDAIELLLSKLLIPYTIKEYPGD